MQSWLKGMRGGGVPKGSGSPLPGELGCAELPVQVFGIEGMQRRRMSLSNREENVR